MVCLTWLAIAFSIFSGVVYTLSRSTLSFTMDCMGFPLVFVIMNAFRRRDAGADQHAEVRSLLAILFFKIRSHYFEGGVTLPACGSAVPESGTVRDIEEIPIRRRAFTSEMRVLVKQYLDAVYAVAHCARDQSSSALTCMEIHRMHSRMSVIGEEVLCYAAPDGSDITQYRSHLAKLMEEVDDLTVTAKGTVDSLSLAWLMTILADVLPLVLAPHFAHMELDDKTGSGYCECICCCRERLQASLFRFSSSFPLFSNSSILTP
jgi:hypothetical protein